MKVNNKTFGIIMLIAWIAILLVKPISNKVDDLITKQPWFDAEIRLFKDGDQIKVEYTKYINRYMNGDWNGWLEYPNRNGIWQKDCSGSGNDNYDPSKSGTVVYTINYFINPTQPCNLSHNGMRVCAAWDMKDANGREKFINPICSPPYNPSLN